jgi:hypothetical protein
MSVSCAACGHEYKPGEKFHNHQPAPLSADSLRDEDFVSYAESLGYRNPMYLPQPIKDCISKAFNNKVAALQAERQWIADSLPENPYTKEKVGSFAYISDLEVGYNAGIEDVKALLTSKKPALPYQDFIDALVKDGMPPGAAVRAVLIPPTGREENHGDSE